MGRRSPPDSTSLHGKAAARMSPWRFGAGVKRLRPFRLPWRHPSPPLPPPAIRLKLTRTVLRKSLPYSLPAKKSLSTWTNNRPPHRHKLPVTPVTSKFDDQSRSALRPRPAQRARAIFCILAPPLYWRCAMFLKRKTLLPVIACLFPLLGTAQSTAPHDPYVVVHGWPQLPDGFVLGQVSGVAADSHNHVFVFHRAENSWAADKTHV